MLRVMALPVVLLLSLVLLPCCPGTPSAATSGDSALGAPHVGKANLDDWISDNVHDFDKRMADIAVDAKCAQLDERLRVAERRRRVITVRQDGKGDFGTISEAVASIPEKNKRRTIVLIGPGAYRERVRVADTKPYVTFYGDSEAMPVKD